MTNNPPSSRIQPGEYGFPLKLKPRYDNFIGGDWVAPVDGEYYSNLTPVTGQPLCEIASSGKRDIDLALDAAHKAKDKWGQTSVQDRAAILFKIADRMEQNLELLATAETWDNGKPIRETMAADVPLAIDHFRYFASCIRAQEGGISEVDKDTVAYHFHEPLGVVAAITPWNSPIASEMQKVAPAIAAGNAVILKPAEATPLMALELARIFEQAGLPAGLLSVLPGKGSVIGDALARHPRVRKISFTGGTTTGRHLAHVAAEKLIPASLELGGKSPTIVLEDADIEQAARGICYGIFSSAGQACIAGSRLFIHESIYAPLMSRLLELTRGLRVGHPFTDGVHVGPLIGEKHRQSVIQYVELAKREGGRVLCGGEIPADPALANGSFFQPTIIEGLSNSARACQEEIFGPVLVAMPFADEATLIREANDSVYGLAAGIWTRDTGRALRLSEQLEAGTVWINTYKVFAISTPFGGFKESGLGREKGIQGLKAWMQQKSIYLATGNSVNHWCD